MAIRSLCPLEVPEKSAFRYTADLKKEYNAALAPSELTTLTLTVYALDAALSIVNSLTAVDILNVGRGTVDSTGKLAVVLAGADLALLDSTRDAESHIMLIQGSYAGGTKFTRHEVEHVIRNLAKVT